MSDSQDAPGGTGIRTGTLLSTRYELQEQIGNGGMGEVWRASDTLLNRPVAVKLLHARHMADETSRERFRTEGRITAVLSHPGIAQVYDYGEQGDHAFLVMELVPGQPLSEILDHKPSGIEPSTVLDIMDQVARALGAAHARGVVHRDLKPGNLLVTEDGSVKLTDFGIARGNESLGLTQTGMVMGTAQYISPEQASGQAATPSSDLYSLGVVAYECLTGSPPFHAESPVALALAHVRETPPPLSEHLPQPLRELVEDLLSKSPSGRPGSTTELVQRIQEARTSVPSLSVDQTTPLSRIVGATSGSALGAGSTGAEDRPPTNSTQPNPPITGPDPSQDDGSVRLAGTAAFRWHPRWVLLAVAAVAVLAIGTALLAQVFDGEGDDGRPGDGDQNSPTPVRDEPESDDSTEAEPVPQEQGHDVGMDTGGPGHQPDPPADDDTSPGTGEPATPAPPEDQGDTQPPDNGNDDSDNDSGQSDDSDSSGGDNGDEQSTRLPPSSTAAAGIT